MSYKRLPGRSYLTLFSRSSLWTGTDHLLLVKNRGYAEEYKRFYYHDVQALIVTRTSVGNLISGILAIFAGFPILLFIVAVIRHWIEIAIIIWGSIAGILLLFLLINWLRGPTCRTEIQTAVQKERLTSLYRLSVAHKAIQRIVPLIVAAQGSLRSAETEAAQAGS